ncbi:PepSY-associated TM helix domain-containing protein [Terrihabitans rhizophilus]|uniref:PepSY-associated TM helix domain-containing protein n=1 Tax=Terrihabitans rhizophilus TaxID=3092662 RepID=A0ABU4RU59_9HYPH|nr:PepSY-associated TM helix domain-containing protein [Terrihabitans sp. PJ23]MDX6807639.1 PepSY-associated TM helix domain-containing protein [Terrihabitans sp. PJ23]
MTDHLQAQAPHGAERARSGADLKAFITRLHFYIGLCVGPFLLVAALTGTLYALTPQLEDALYASALHTESRGPAQSLAAQAAAGRAVAGPGATLFAVRPATSEGRTTRVMFSAPDLGVSESRAIFVDPVILRVTGDEVVYGTSGTLPLRTTLDRLHRDLLLGEPGRVYSELAASWLWVVTLGGVLLWWWRRQSRARLGLSSARRLHGLIGLWLSVGVLFLSATGLTWSRWAGDNIDAVRSAFGLVTPSVQIQLDGAPAQAMAGEHVHDGMETAPATATPVDPVALLDPVLAAARAAGIDAANVEIRPARKPDQAWVAREIDRGWPTQVDTVAVDPRSLAATSAARFADFPLVAKLIQWGIAAHMGILFGPVNQVLVAMLGIFLMVTTVLGYAIWWRRRPAPGALPRTLTQSWTPLPLGQKAMFGALALVFGWALPVLGASLALFFAIDAARWAWTSRRRRSAPPRAVPDRT